MTESSQSHSIVAIYDTHPGAEAAVKELQQSGLDMKRLSIVGRDFHTEEHAVGFYTAGDRMKFWGARGAFWGSLWGMLFGSALFFIPAIGPVVVMGPLVVWFVGALEGAALGGAAGVLAAALTSVGLPNDSVIKYEVEVKAGKFLVLAQGTAEMIVHARAVLETTGAAQLTDHAAPLSPGMESDRRGDYVTRDRILNLLSDNEIASVSTAETAARLADGDEYLDLEHLDQGVRQAPWTMAPMGRVLPRKAVQEHTWSQILTQLPAPRSATAQTGT